MSAVEDDDDASEYYMSSDGEVSQGDSDDNTDDDDDGYGNAMSGAEFHVVPKEAFQCFSAQEVRAKQQEAVARVVAVLQVTSDEATQLLRAFKWNVNRVNDEWFQNEEEVRAKVGLMPVDAMTDASESEHQVTCGVCFDEFPASSINHVARSTRSSHIALTHTFYRREDRLRE